jgi:hypothetical protein
VSVYEWCEVYERQPTMAPPSRDEVVDNGDGTYSIPDPNGGDWMVYDTGEGWEASHPSESFGCRWPSAQEAIRAVLDNPYFCEMYGGGTYAEHVGGV